MKLSTLSLALISTASYFGSISAQNTVFELTPTYHEPKNVMFFASMGGSSHIVWVLSILEEMASRGHQTTFVTKDDQLKFLKEFPVIKGISTGEPILSKKEYRNVMDVMAELHPVDVTLFTMEKFSRGYVKDYNNFIKLFNENKPDLVVCDHFTSPCSDAAYNTNRPFVVTSSMALSPDSDVPYINLELFSMHHHISNGISFFDRFNDKIISPVRFLYKAWPIIQRINREKKKAGIPVTMNPMVSWSESIKIVNSVFGIEAPRPVGPLVHFVGPILPKRFPVLNDNLRTFLDSRKKVVYVGFGQMAIPNAKNIKMIMTSMLENMENNDLDGIIWSTRGIETYFPDYITTQSNKTYDIRSLFDSTSANQTSVAFVDWAPQVAILNHPSTVLFLTHGGAGSLYEAFYNGVPLIVFPFFGDQPAMAYNADRIGFGRWMKSSSSQKEATNAVQEVLRDVDGKYNQITKKYQALVQIRSRYGVQRGADLMEEAIYTNKNGRMTLQSDLKNDLSTAVTYNLDLYAALAFLILTPLYTFYRLFSYYIHNLKAPKLKKA